MAASSALLTFFGWAYPQSQEDLVTAFHKDVARLWENLSLAQELAEEVLEENEQLKSKLAHRESVLEELSLHYNIGADSNSTSHPHRKTKRKCSDVKGVTEAGQETTQAPEQRLYHSFPSLS